MMIKFYCFYSICFFYPIHDLHDNVIVIWLLQGHLFSSYLMTYSATWNYKEKSIRQTLSSYIYLYIPKYSVYQTKWIWIEHIYNITIIRSEFVINIIITIWHIVEYCPYDNIGIFKVTLWHILMYSWLRKIRSLNHVRVIITHSEWPRKKLNEDTCAITT